MKALALGLASALVLSACAASKPKAHFATGVIQSPKTESLAGKVRGGVLTVLSATDFDSIDPGVAHSELDYEAIYATQRPLFSYKPNMFAEAVPDLAAAPAQISADGRTVTVHIRRGVHFSPPVDREVTTADVAYAIERGANPNVANPYFKAYFSSLAGAKTADGGRISGIATPNRYTIVFHVTDGKAWALVDALALPLSAPVPEEFAKRYDAERPSQYGNYQVATGPYMFKASARGKVLGVGYSPGRSATLVRNPNWRASTDFRPAYLHEIQIEFGGSANVLARQVLAGSDLVQNDPPAPIVQLADARLPKQLQLSPDAGSRYVAVNNKQGPFSKIDVRKAFWAALDRVAMNAAVGGPLLAQVANHFLYPGIPGFYIAHNLITGAGLTYNEHPNGDVAVAESYMRQAGYPTGKYSGSETLSVVGATGEPLAKIAEIANSTLHRLGFKTALTLVSESAMYAKYCGVPAREIDVCPDVGWRADFADGQAVLYEAFDGNEISPTDNKNWGQTNEADLNSALEREARVLGSRPREQSWAAMDNGVVDDAAAIPYAWMSEAEIESRDVTGVGDLWNAGAWDYSFTSLR